jgi:quercetin dioxygenase-like cupin family protein
LLRRNEKGRRKKIRVSARPDYRRKRMSYYHRWEEFPEQTAYYLKDNPDCQGIRSRKISGDHIMVSKISVKGGAKIPRHYHEAEQIMFIQKGKAHVSTGDAPLRTLGPGDIWVVPSNIPHGVEYEGDLEAMEVVSPPRVDTLIGYVVPHTFFEKVGK